MPNNAATFKLNIPADDYRRFYEGSAAQVQARTLTGTTIRFPASILRQFVSHDGVHGLFRISYDDTNKFRSIERLP